VKRIGNVSTLARIIVHTFVPGRWRITFPKKTPSNGESETIDFFRLLRVGDVAGRWWKNGVVLIKLVSLYKNINKRETVSLKFLIDDSHTIRT
jgi:hypothetical protein